MANTTVNKVVLGNETLIDLTPVTVTADKLASGYTALDASGALITGTATQGGVTQDAQGYIVLPETGGSVAQYPWLGAGAEKVSTELDMAINLKDDTGYDEWEASTTVTTLIEASVDPDFTVNADFSNYDYCLVTKGFIQPVYAAGTPETYRTHRVAQYHIYYCYGYPKNSDIDNIQNDTAGYVSSFSTATNLYIQIFRNNAGNLVARSGTQCGPLYMSTYPTVTSSVENDGTITYKLPAFYAKCDASRFNTERKGQVDSANTDYRLTVDLYRVPHGNGLTSYWVSQVCAALNAS